MLCNLLVERFHLKAHIEQRQFPGYELILAKTGSKLKQSDASAAPPPAARRSAEDGFPSCRLTGRAWHPGTPPPAPSCRCDERPSRTGLDVCQLAASPGRPSCRRQDGVDRTVRLHPGVLLSAAAAAPDNPAEPSALPDLFAALQQQPGLQLVSRKLPFDVVVVESFDKTPTEN